MKYKLYVDLCSDLDHYMVLPAILFRPPLEASDRITAININFEWLRWSFSVCIWMIKPKDLV